MTLLKTRWRALPIAALLLAGVASVAFALGAASGTPLVAGAQPTTIPGHPELGGGWLAPNGFGRGMMGDTQISITITAISGNSLTLKTTDGWTRTIDATGATITKAGQTISVSALKVGDQIAFRESRQSDGTFKITSITVVVPTVEGTVSSVGAGSITVTLGDGSTKVLTTTSATTYTKGGASVSRSTIVTGNRIEAQGMVDSSGNFTATSITIAPDVVVGTVSSKTASTIVVTTAAGKTVTVNVTASTTYRVAGVASATLANVAVGNRIAAEGALQSNGSLNATIVVAATNDQPGFGFGFGFGRGFGGDRGFGGFGGFGHGFGGLPLQPAPSSSPSSTSTSSTGI